MKKNVIDKTTKREQRCVPIELRDSDAEIKKIVGMPIVYEKPSEDMGFIEYVKTGAAKKALQTSDARALYGHNSDALLPLGRQSSGTLILRDTKDGVEMELFPPKTQFARDLIESIERGDIREMSFGFTIESDEWLDLDKPTPKRTITKLKEIFDVSFVAFAAYNDTSVALRSLDKAKAEIPSVDSEAPIPITITDNDAIFAFDNFEQFDRVAQKVAELRVASGPTSEIAPGNPPEGPTSEEGFPPEMDKLEERMSCINERISKVSISAQIKEIEAL